ncbi:capsule biosynthesis protein [Acidisphaera sp. L21]|uniref:capsule biosynthesis protein n=1 Tax=Acidisphaera sp. L21 TaxID=1641851 RepID=UPI001C209CFF|nr:capsular biosynthesis protein [Acidisphaera sp. L21]
MTIINDSAAGQRSFLFLQGMASQFFARLGKSLAARGHIVHRVNFNAGDMAFWRLPGGINYRGTAEAWPEFLADVLETRRVTDVILFGDCRPLHQAAIRVIRDMQVQVHVCEEGYIRPYWVTFERDGVNGHSNLPRNPDYYREFAATLPPMGAMPHLVSKFWRRAREDLLYNFASMTFGFLYPHYRTHRPHHRLIEYAGWSWKVIRSPLAKRRSARLAAEMADESDFYLFPMQLNCDTQIRLHSTFGSMTPVIQTIIDSFRRHAPASSKLVIKEHPMDDGLINWRRLVARLAAESGVADRVIYLEVGNLDALIARTRGVVTVNSTTGTLALATGVPLMVLGTAIYDIPGLTHQAGLDRFWTEAAAPDQALFDAFRRVIADRCLLVGGFFSEDAITQLVANAVTRLEAQVAPHPASRADFNAVGSIAHAAPSNAVLSA